MACVAPNYSMDGQTACTTCPTGYVCYSPSQGPYVCTQGTIPNESQLQCDPCPIGQHCPSPNTTNLITPTPNLKFHVSSAGQAYSFPCPAGKTCTSSSSDTVCSSPKYSEFGTSLCSESATGFFAPNNYMTSACPTGTYQNQAGQTVCNLCDAGKSCSTDTSATPTACTEGQFSALGSTKCDTSFAGYMSTSTLGAAMTPCEEGTYHNSAANTCIACPVGSTCSETNILTDAEIDEAHLKCPMGYYPNGKGCQALGQRTQYFPFDAANKFPTCTDTQYINGPGLNCTSCPADQACYQLPCVDGTCPAGPKTFLPTPRKCPIGYYLTSNNCRICPEGSFCTSSSQSAPVACPSGTYSGQGYTQCFACPSGFKCPNMKKSSIEACPTGSTSQQGSSSCVACTPGKACPSPDLAEEGCLTGTYQDTASMKNCKICPTGSKCDKVNMTASTACVTGTQFAFLGSEKCETCPTTSQCTLDRFGVSETCLPGEFYDSGAKTCSKCPENFQCANNTKSVCPPGTKYDETFEKCVECADTHICVYDQASGANMAEDEPGKNRWCYGKDPAMSSILDQFVNANRLPAYHYQWCIDCKSPELLNSICTFSTNYFTAQAGKNISCPITRSQKQTVMIDGIYYEDRRFFMANLADYPYPFCMQNGVLYQPNFQSEKPFESVCLPGVEYLDQRMIATCRPTFPGFISTSRVGKQSQYQTPTDEPLSTQYSIMEKRDFGTKTVLKVCPDGQEFVTDGAASESQGCLFKKAGDCKDLKSPFCHDGVDFKCPRGLRLKDPTSTSKKTKNECYQVCELGMNCAPELGTQGQACPAGRSCYEGSESPDQQVTRPGRILQVTPSSADPLTYYVEQDCVLGMCKAGDSQDANFCPAGFHLDVSKNAHNPFNCHPNAPSKFTVWTPGSPPTSVDTACADGYYCPEAVRSADQMIPCEPGTYSETASLGSGLQSKTQCKACPEGKFCGAGTKTSTVENCKGGFYCPTRAHHKAEYACPAGKWSAEGNNFKQSSECSTCDAGKYCKEGSDSQTTCPANAFCPQSSGLFQDCPKDTHRSSTGGQSSSDCTSCSSYTICPGGTDEIQCPAGTNGIWTDKNFDPKFMVCKPTDSGKKSSTPATAQTTCPAGTYSSPYATECYDCPEGSYCVNGVKTDCSVGQYCPRQSSSPQTCPEGSYCKPAERENRIKVCPAGRYCPASSSDPSVTPANYFNVQGEASGTLHQCGNGYTCPNPGSTGPYQSPCGVNSKAGLGATECTPCSIGRWCPLGSTVEIDCPQGYYCDGIQIQPIKCPRGTYGHTINLKSALECKPCDGGKTCSQNGLTAPDGDCDAGFFCSSGSWTPRPDNRDLAESKTGGVCTIGGYCPRGSNQSSPCPSGTFNSFPGMRSPLDCIPCTPGYYCAGSASSKPTNSCDPGYYCTGGSNTPQQFPAQPGYYALRGSTRPIKCEAGTFSNSTISTACTPCLAGKYCPDIQMTAGKPCPKGNFCSVGAINPAPCKIGTFNPTDGSDSSGACQNCTAGQYCNRDGLEAVVGKCSAGFYCKSGSPSKYPYVNYAAQPFGLWSLTSYSYGICPKGYHCPEGSSEPQKCPIGTYLNAEGSEKPADCIRCQPGWYCSKDALETPEAKCDAGYYCPEGTDTKNKNECPIGSYCPVGSSTFLKCPAGQYQDLTVQSACKPCEAGYFCEEGSAAQEDCPVGAYCPAGSTQPTLCPIGTLNLLKNQITQSVCLDCPQDKFCKVSGASALDQVGYGDLYDGYVNTVRSRYPVPIPSLTNARSYCDRGNYCLKGVQNPCDAGYYCEEYNMTKPTGKCLKGYYCLAGSMTKTPTRGDAIDKGAKCPAGQYCDEGSSAGTKCPAGTFSNGTGLFGVADCNICPDGYMCPTPGVTALTIVNCTQGFYCQAGTDESAKTKTACPPGSFCPQRSPWPQPCPPGQYQDLTGQTACKVCEIGKYCPYQKDSGMVPESGYIVSAVGMPGPAPCEPGTFRDSSKNPSNTACEVCPAGFYCDDYAMDAATAKKPIICPAGYYCPDKTSDFTQNICPPSTYCPQGSPAALDCPAGKYCDAFGLSLGKDCSGGYFCKGKAKVPNPDDSGITGYQCPKGQYCEPGAAAPKLCPIGSYNDKEGADSKSYCIRCPATKTCLTEGLASPGSDCPAGYYCSLAADDTTSVQNPCEQGYRCPAGSFMKQRCLPGTYQDQTTQSECKICPKGKYCYEDNGQPITSPKACPAGYYCADQSQTFAPSPRTISVYSPQPCVEGTFSASTGLGAAAECTACPETFRCTLRGLNDRSKLETCVDGYLCKEGTAYATEVECAINNFCIAGVSYECPPGTYSEVTGLASDTECVECPPGFVCPQFQSSRYKCPAGQYCLGKVSAVADASGACPNGRSCPIKCPIGKYCPEGSFTPLSCPAGTYQDQDSQTTCKVCPAGSYCDGQGMSVPVPCMTGMYCPEGSLYPKACPYGQLATADQTSCQNCPRGKYCWPEKTADGAQSLQATCEKGYVCQDGSFSPKPRKIDPTSSQFDSYNGPARRGYTSTDGSYNEICPKGTYQPSLYGQECQKCLKGSICDEEGIGQLTMDFHPCPQGKICKEGLSDSSQMGTCPAGQYIETGSPHCLFCPNGYYIDGSITQCKACPFGKFCKMIDTQIPQNCTDASQCLGGNSYDPHCSAGLWLNTTTVNFKNGTSATTSKCDPCPIGRYCVGGIDAGNCTAGHFCEGGAATPTPDTFCEVGFYCEHGAKVQKPCDPGFFRSTKGGIQASDCSACEGGQICKLNEKPYDCPLGYYCPVGIDLQIACPAGTYGARTRLMVVSECIDCPPGVICSRPALTESNIAQTEFLCPKGKYCLTRTLAPTDCPAGTYRDITGGRHEADCFACPIGNYCPRGAASPILCKAGTHCPAKSAYFKTCRGGYYCNSLTNMTEKICPMNNYCPRGSSAPIRCGGRFICSEGSELPQVCEAGTIVQRGGTNEVNYCLDCAPGTYSTILDSTCKNCSAGFVCYGRTTKWKPTNPLVHRGEICPKGHYCPEASSLAIPCPVGTYNGDFGALSIAQCLFCPDNTFNDKTGQEGCRPCGAFATASEGSATCECLGNFRTFSHADSSCRCMSGYDFVDAITGMSIGKESGFENCSPLVFDRCDGVNQTRSASGACVSVSDCSRACNGGPGKRSLTLGVCTCDNNQNVDLVCNQNCRSNAPKMSIGNGTSIQIATKAANGSIVTTNVDLAKVGSLYGSLTCETGDSCDIKTTEMGPSGGFYGKYGAPSLVDTAIKKLRLLEAEDRRGRILRSEHDFDLQDEVARELQVSQVDYTAQTLRNPVVCVARGDSMLFSIRDPRHYPVYLKDSVMNSNPSFDYGQFLILADQMKTKLSYNDTKPSLFAFTFTQQGGYVFTDSADQEQLMIVRVTGAGESCPDPDRYIQPLAGESVASQGVSQNQDIIIKPDVPLLVGMGTILVVAILTVMIGVGYCLHKGWSLPKVNLRGYRNLYQVTDLDHTNKDVFTFGNDFSKYKSYHDDGEKKDPLHDSMVEDEDDLDDINLNIHLDLLSAGQDYLQIYGEKKEHRKKEKSQRKSEVVKLMHEIEQLINTIGSDAMIQGMQLFDENAAAEDEDGGSPKKGDKNLPLHDPAKEEEDRKKDEERREKLMQEWSDRDRELLDKAKQEAKESILKIKKDLNKNVLELGDEDRHNDGQAAASDQMAIAIYDNNDVKSRQNKLVNQIEQDKNLTDAEKETLLRLHNQNLTNIGEMMDADKRKQDAELERAIKDRVERRKKALEAKYKKEITLEIKEGELRIKEDIDERKRQGIKTIDDEINQKIEEAASRGDKGSYKRTVDELKKERGERKTEIEEQLGKEQEVRLESLRETVLRKWTADAVNTDADLEALLLGQPDTDLALAQLKQQRAQEEDALEAKLRLRRKRLKDDLKQEKDQFEAEIQTKDLVAEEEYVKKKQNVLSAQAAAQQDASTSQLGGYPRQSDLTQDPASSDTFKRTLLSIDSQLSASAALRALRDQGADPELLARLIKDQELDEERNLQARRDLLRQRRQLKKQQELEGKKLEEQMLIMKEEDDEKAKIAKGYLRDMFKQADVLLQNRSLVGLDQQQPDLSKIQQERLVVFNEYASDALLKRLSNLLMKQFVEKEAALKLLVQKYMDARLIEKANIKRHYRDEAEKLQGMANQGSLDPAQLREAVKTLRLQEENMLRDADLQLERAHREEEIRLRGELDKKHADEQVWLRKQELEDQLNLKKELILSQPGQAGQAAAISAKDDEIDKISLKAYEEAKKREMERKQRALAMHKQEIMKQIDQDMKNKYSDYDELLKRKREEEAALSDANLSIRKRLQDRKKQLKEQTTHFSQADLKLMRERHQLNLETLDSVFEEERRRQRLMMEKRLAQRKLKTEKHREMRAKVEVQEVGRGLKEGGIGQRIKVEYEMLDIDENKDNDLLRQLREWARNRQEFKSKEEQRRLAETSIDLDPLSIKKLITKLDNLEKGLKELRRMEMIKQKLPQNVVGGGASATNVYGNSAGRQSPIPKLGEKQAIKANNMPILDKNNRSPSTQRPGQQVISPASQQLSNVFAKKFAGSGGNFNFASPDAAAGTSVNPFNAQASKGPNLLGNQIVSGVLASKRTSPKSNQLPQPEPPKGPHGNMDDYKNFKKFTKKR